MHPYLERIQHIDVRIQEIRDSGEVAPPNLWINQTRAGSKRQDGSYKYYTYHKLMEFTGEKTRSGKRKSREVQYLGKSSHANYQHWQAAIQRRNQIAKLRRERRELLQGLSEIDISDR